MIFVDLTMARAMEPTLDVGLECHKVLYSRVSRHNPASWEARLFAARDVISGDGRQVQFTLRGDLKRAECAGIMKPAKG